MRKICLLLAAVICLAFLPACDSEIMGGYNSLINPMETASGVDDLNAKVGCSMKKPYGVTFPEYYTIKLSDEVLLAQYTFRKSGKEYVFRAGKTQNDITGVWVDGKTLGDSVEPGVAVEPVAIKENSFWARWFDGEMQYTLYLADGTLSGFQSIYKELHG